MSEMAAAAWVRKRWDAVRVREHDERARRLESVNGRAFASGFECRAVCLLIAKHGRRDVARAIGVTPHALTQFATQDWRQRPRCFALIRERLAKVLQEGMA